MAEEQLELFGDVEYEGDLNSKYWKVPFVDEVQEFNDTFGKPIGALHGVPFLSEAFPPRHLRRLGDVPRRSIFVGSIFDMYIYIYIYICIDCMFVFVFLFACV